MTLTIYISTFIALIILFFVVIKAIKIKKKKYNSKVSFKESLDLTGVPVITFYCNKEKLNFILDTGSNTSHINSALLNTIEAEQLPYTERVIGMEGVNVICNHYNITIHYRNLVFTEKFLATDLTAAFKQVKEETGVQLHGILGSDFFEKHKYILDFKTLTAYIK